MPGGRPKKFRTAKQMSRKAEEYFQLRDEQEKPYGIAGLAYFLGFTRQTFINYNDRPEFLDTVQRLKARCEQSIEDFAMAGKIAPALSTFILKNYKWSDTTQIEQSGPGGGPVKQAIQMTFVRPGDIKEDDSKE